MGSKGKNIAKKITAVVLMPLLVYLIMLIIGAFNGKTFNIFNWNSLSSIMESASYMCLVALGIGFQLKYGRFDFSGGAIIVVTAIVSAKVAVATNLNLEIIILVGICIGILLSLLNAVIYVYSRVPISVISLATAFLLESFSGLIIGNDAVPQLMYNSNYNVYNTFPLILIPLLLGIGIYVIYGHFTVQGRRSALLRANQKSAVNIGINEKRNTIITYVVSGFIFGLAGVLYATSNNLAKVTTPLETAGTLFSNIVPSLVGLFLSRYIDDSLGTFIGALTITILYYGLDLIGVTSGVKIVSYSVFLAIFIFISGFWDQIYLYFKNLFIRIFKRDKCKALK